MKKLALILLLVLTLGLPVQAAFHLPPIKTGFAFRTRELTGITLTKAVQLKELNFSDRNDWLKILGDWEICGGIGQDLAFVSLDYIIFPVVNLSIGAYWGYDWQIKGFQTGYILQWIIW